MASMQANGSLNSEVPIMTVILQLLCSFLGELCRRYVSGVC